MCNLYSMTRNVDAIRRLFQVDPLYDRTGNLPPLPGIYPDYPAPIVRNGTSGRELAMARWGIPSTHLHGSAGLGGTLRDCDRDQTGLILLQRSTH
jgi:putative SOS response-associated peptidase YedK